MKIVVIKSPKALGALLKLIFFQGEKINTDPSGEASAHRRQASHFSARGTGSDPRGSRKKQKTKKRPQTKRRTRRKEIAFLRSK